MRCMTYVGEMHFDLEHTVTLMVSVFRFNATVAYIQAY